MSDTTEILETTDKIFEKTANLVISAIEKASPTVHAGWDVLVQSTQILSVVPLVMSLMVMVMAGILCYKSFFKADWKGEGNKEIPICIISGVVWALNFFIFLSAGKHWALGTFVPEGRLLRQILSSQGLLP